MGSVLCDGMSSGSGLFPKKVTARTFVGAEVVRAVGRTEDWRKRDGVRKAYRRRGLRAVKT
jgi:hypothetical protein